MLVKDKKYKKHHFYGSSFFSTTQNFWENHKDKDIQKIVFACDRAGHVDLLL